MGTAYSATLAASGGTTPYSWSLTSGTLPAGLTLNAATGAITGTPTATANGISLTFKVTDSGSPAQSQSATLTMTIAPTTLSIATTTLPSGQVGTAYSATLAASGGTTPYSWSLTSGTLPAGLTLNAATGAITGTPTATANGISLTFKVTDSSSPAQSQSATLTLTIVAPSGTIAAVQRDIFTSLTCAPVCPTETIASTGAGNLLFVAALNAGNGSAPANIANISCTPSCGTWIYPGAACRAWSAQSAGEDCAYVLSSSAGATSITVTMSATSNQSQSLSFREYHSTAGGFGLSGGPSASLLSACTSCLTPNISVTGNNVLIAGGTPDHGFTGMAAPFGGVQFDGYGAIVGDNLNTTSGTGATLTENASGVASVFTIGFMSPAGALSILTSSLPSGQVGTAYSATLAASGGTTPYNWSLTSGTLPAGLTLNAATGAITGTPTATANATSLTFTVTDSSSPTQSKSVNVSLTIVSFAISVSLSPKHAGLAIKQNLSITPTTNDSAGVSWAASGSSCSGTGCGTFSATTSVSGTPVTYTAPATAGIYTIAATSVTDGSTAASISVAVTDLTGVTTYHNDLSRDGANTQEYALNKSNVQTATFGKLFSCSVDEAVYAQPLWMPNLTVNSAQHNIVVVATQNDSVYAFDADASPCLQLWHANLLDSTHGANSGETSVPSGTSGFLVGHGAGDITPEVGITGTPVIDPSTNTLYVVSKSMNSAGSAFYQRLHAIDLTNGSEKFSGPTNIAATFPGNGDGGSTDTFVARQENQRPGLALVNGVVYIAWAGHEDTTPYYGWIAGYNASNLNLPPSYVFNTDPNEPSSPTIGYAQEAGIWMSGGAPAADSFGNLYLTTGNGSFDPTTGDYGDSLLQLTGSLTIGSSTYFTPSDQQTDQTNDQDFGAGGVVLVNLPANGSNPTQLAIAGGKDNGLYVLDRTKLGGLGDGNAWQKINPNSGSGIFGTGAFWNNTLYLATYGGKLQAFSLSPSTAMLTEQSNASATYFNPLGTTPSVSSMPDNTNGIVWALDNTQYCTNQASGCGPAILHAYDATNLSTELWNSSQGSGNTAGHAVKFTVPTVANGKVYVGTRGNNTGGADNSTTIPGELDVYGLLP